MNDTPHPRLNVGDGGGKAVKALLEQFMELPVDERVDFLEMLVCAGIHFMRGDGKRDEYVRGFLTSALKDLDSPPWLLVKQLDKN